MWKEDLEKFVEKNLSLSPNSYSLELLKRSVDLRRGRRDFICHIVIKVENPISKKIIGKNHGQVYTFRDYSYDGLEKTMNPIVVGAGPAGLFAAYSLALRGANPVVIEQGKPVEERIHDVEKFWETGNLNSSSNIQFGEGGAGAFSDGKLTSRSKDPRITEVLKVFVKHGGPEDILYVNKPHIGTDLLRKVIVNIRKTILSLGGRFYFNHEVEGLLIEGTQVVGVKTKERNFHSNTIILATGHSARHLFYALEDVVAMENKPFAVGLRIEHPQFMINEVQYKKDALIEEILGAADYHLTWGCKEENRGTYTFCMCPGGLVVGAASEENHLVVNGMSYHARDLKNANSALLVTVDERDYGKELFAGIEFQRKLEKKAFDLGGGGYIAPVQSVPSFLGKDHKMMTSPTYLPGTKESDLRSLFSTDLVEKLQMALKEMDQKLPGFGGPLGTLTGVESRSSSPVRMLRNRDMESVNVKGLYPIGEGAGYAGGIMSSAVDGLKVAERLWEVSKNKKEKLC